MKQITSEKLAQIIEQTVIETWDIQTLQGYVIDSLIADAHLSRFAIFDCEGEDLTYYRSSNKVHGVEAGETIRELVK